MERDSFLYKARRKCQVLAHKVVSNEAMSKLYYKIVLHKKLNLDNPQTFNEKIQWMKLYYYPKNPLVVNCSDKYAVRDYITEKGYGDRLVPLLGVMTYLSYENIYSLFPVVGCLLTFISFLSKNVNKIRFVGIISTACWLIYAIIYVSYSAIIFEVIILIAAVIAYIKNKKH